MLQWTMARFLMAVRGLGVAKLREAVCGTLGIRNRQHGHEPDHKFDPPELHFSPD